MREKITLPQTALRTVMTANAPNAPRNTIDFLYFMAMIIARKKVLSPVSQTRIASKEVENDAKRLFS